MKKPEITEGEWMYSNGQITEQEGYSIAEYVSEHDGQAMSAVPEMIDALVEFKRRYSNEVHNQDFHKQVEQALKKAGCGK